jgi:hypothetical protein
MEPAVTMWKKIIPMGDPEVGAGRGVEVRARD